MTRKRHLIVSEKAKTNGVRYKSQTEEPLRKTLNYFQLALAARPLNASKVASLKWPLCHRINHLQRARKLAERFSVIVWMWQFIEHSIDNLPFKQIQINKLLLSFHELLNMPIFSSTPSQSILYSHLSLQLLHPFTSYQLCFTTAAIWSFSHFGPFWKTWNCHCRIARWHLLAANSKSVEHFHPSSEYSRACEWFLPWQEIRLTQMEVPPSARIEPPGAAR